MNDSLLIYINGRRHEIRGADAFRTLSEYLRAELGATGTKVVCEEGDCGACTVLLGRLDGDAITYQPVNSCIQFLYQLNCAHAVTVEGVLVGGALNAVQESMIRNHGAQCGYCTPGFIVAMTAMAESGVAITDASVREALTGNLCRCTGYEPIIKAALELEPNALVAMNELYPPRPMIESFRAHLQNEVQIRHGSRRFFAPLDVASAVRYRKENPGTVIVQGGTDIGVQCNKRGLRPESIMSLANLPGLREMEIRDGIVIVGARVTLAELERFAADHLPELHGILSLFGSPQIRNAGTLAGNIANASPIADTLPFLYVMNARLELAGSRGERLVEIGSFYKGYKTLDLGTDEMITRILIPLPEPGDIVRLYKVSKRKDLDISTITAAIRMRVESERIESIALAFGGVAPTVVRLPRTEEFLRGRKVTLETFEQAGVVARNEIKPISDVRGSADFRRRLGENLMVKFYYEVFESEGADAVAS